MPTIQHNHARLYYEVHGKGYPVIFIHGGGGNTMAWYQQVPHFRNRYKVITVDLRGFKNSTCAAEYVHPRFFADDLRSIMDAENLPEAALVCQSLGAWAGLRLAVQSPERISCLFINGSPTPAYSEENWRVIDRANSIFMGGDFGNSSRNTSVGWNREIVSARPEMTFLYSQIKSLNPPFNSRTMEDDSIKIYPDELEHYSIPTTVAGGAHDDFLNPHSHFHAASLIPGATPHTFESAGHSAYFETPDEFNKVLDEFLQCHLSDKGQRKLS